MAVVAPHGAAGAVAEDGRRGLGSGRQGGKSLGGKAATHGARAAGDWAWHGLGIGVATASAGFATYALVFSTGEVVPSGNFNIFARYDHIYQAPAARRGAPADTAATPDGAPPSDPRSP